MRFPGRRQTRSPLRRRMLCFNYFFLVFATLKEHSIISQSKLRCLLPFHFNNYYDNCWFLIKLFKRCLQLQLIAKENGTHFYQRHFLKYRQLSCKINVSRCGFLNFSCCGDEVTLSTTFIQRYKALNLLFSPDLS